VRGRKGDEAGGVGAGFAGMPACLSVTSMRAPDSGYAAAVMDSHVVPPGLARFVVLSDMSIAS